MKIKIRSALILINTTIIIVTAAVIIWIYSAGTKHSVYSISDNLMKEITNSVVSKTASYLQPVEKANINIGFHYWNPEIGDFRDNQELTLSYFKELLKANFEFVMVYFADDKGNLTMGRRMPDGSLSKRYINRTQTGVEIRFDHENKQYNALYPDSIEPLSTGYDPRKRVWYKTVIEKKMMYWTDVYIFATDKMLGFSCAMPIYAKNGSIIGVSCIDIGIKDLSLFLGRITLTKNAKLFIIDSQNQIIAQPINSDDLIDTLFNIETIDGVESRVLRKINTINDKVLSTSFATHMEQKDNNKPFSYTIDGKRYLSMYSSLALDRGLNFKIGIIIPDQDIMGGVYKNNKIILLVSIAFIFCVVLFSFFMSLIISKPMKILSLQMNKIKKFSFDDEKEIKTVIKEIDGMITSFMGMKKGLINFRKYVPLEVVNQLIQNEQDANIGGEKKELTIFFSDIANFTNISEMISPEELVNQLCEYFSLMSHTIIDTKGTLDKYIGDSIMAFWGAPLTFDNHAYLACKSALICKDLTYNLFHQWKREGKQKFHTRIGLHTGEVIVGNMGYEKRINYTIIGDNVNLASRLESINKQYGTEIIISQSTYEIVKTQFECRKLDLISVKGKSKPVTIYELLAEKGKLSKNRMKIIDVYEDGIQFYFEGNWSKAIYCMDFILKHVKDQPAIVIKERCIAFSESPPAQWNGVHVFNEK